MPASKDPGPQDQKTQKRKEWSTPRLRLLGNHKPETPPILEPIGPWPPAAADRPDH